MLHGLLAFTIFFTNEPLLHKDPKLEEWLFQDKVITTWMLKKAIPSIGEPIKLISPSKALWYEWLVCIDINPTSLIK